MRFFRPDCLILLILPWLSLVAACQPSPESRMQAAEAYATSGQYRSAVIELRNLLSEQPENLGARALLAEVSMELADYLSAENEYLRVLEQRSDLAEAWVAYGRAILSQGRPGEVIEKVLPALVILDGSAPASVLRGDTMLVMGELQAAENAYREALQLEPEYSDALAGLAATKGAVADYGEVSALLDRAVQSDPENSRAWVSKGNFHARHRQAGAGMSAFRRAIDIESRTDPTGLLLVARVNLISFLLDQREFAAAKPEIEQLEAEYRGYPVAHFLKGRVALGERDYVRATTELQTYVAAVPKDRRAQAALGTAHFSRSDLLQAEMYLSQAVRENVGGASARQLLAETQLRLDKPGLALQLLQASDTRGNEDPMLSAMLGRAQAGIGDKAAALAHFERGLASGEADASTMLLISSGMLALGEADEAIAVLESIPHSGDSKFRREVLMVAAHLSRSETDSAIAVVDELVVNNPGSSMAHSTAGTVLLYANQDDKARLRFETALRLDGSNTGALFGLARYWIRNDDDNAARSNLERILALEPSYVPALFELAVLAREEDQWQRFWVFLDEAIVSMPEHAGLRLFGMEIANRIGDYARTLSMAAEADELSLSHPGITHANGVALFRTGATEQGAAMLAQAARTTAAKPQYHFDYAVAQFELGECPGALQSIRSFRQARAASVEGLVLEVHCLLKTGSTAEGRDALQRFMAAGNEDNRLHILDGDLLMAEGRPRLAIAAFAKAAGEAGGAREVVFRLVSAHVVAGTGEATGLLRAWIIEHPDDNESRLMYGQLAAESGNKSDEVEAYESVLERDPDNIMALNNLAWEYALQGRDEAIVLAEKVHGLRPENGAITDTLGWIYYLQARYTDSVRLLETAARQAPDDAEIQFHLASALAKTDRREEAKSILVRILENHDSFPSRQHAESLVAQL